MTRFLPLLILVLLAPAAAQQSFADRFRAALALDVAEVEARRMAFASAYRSFIEFDGASAAYRRHRLEGAAAALYSGQHRASVRLYREAAATAPLSGHALFESLVASTRSGDLVGAASAAKARVNADREAVHAWLRGPIPQLYRASDFARIAAFGGAQLQAGEPSGLWLLQEQERAFAGRPGREYALANLALAYRQSGRAVESERAYREALRLAPTFDWLWNDFGLLLKGLGRIPEAVSMFVSGSKQEANPGASAAGTNLGVLFQRTGKRRGRDPEADLQQVLKARPDAAMARRLLLDGLRIGR